MPAAKGYRLPRTRLSLIRESSRKFAAPPPAGNAEEAAAIARKFIKNSPIEQLIALCMDSANNVRTVITLSIGGASQTSVIPLDIIRSVLVSGWKGFILCHNHPSGNPMPSQEDVNLTKRVYQAANTIDLNLLDHVILGDDNRYFSLMENNLLR